jgi:hypothetical protein
LGDWCHAPVFAEEYTGHQVKNMRLKPGDQAIPFFAETIDGNTVLGMPR